MTQPAASSSFTSVLDWVLDARDAFDALLSSGADVAAAPCGLADEDLMDAVVQVESVGRIIDGLRVRMAGEVAARSAAEYGDEGLTRAHNFGTVPKYLAAVTGASERTLAGRVRLASSVRSSMSLVGLPNPSRFPRVAEALARGDIGVDVASVITRRLTDAASRIGFTEELEDAEGDLVSRAQQGIGGLGYSANEVDRLAIHHVALLDADGAEPRDADLHAKRFLTLRPHCSGMTKLSGLLSPGMSAVVASALEPFTSPRIVAFTDTPASGDADSATAAGGEVDDLTADSRSAGQKRVDALVNLLAMAAGLPEVPRLNGAAPTVNLHATLDDVVAGRGVGWIDGLTEPVPYTTVEALLCHADVITTLFGEQGQVLQHGKTRRLFTAHQNRALAARDGGCVWPGCTAPPSWCESHHVDGWLSDTHPGGRTDIDNGALLCHFHHTNVHKARWKLTIRNGTPHLIPPKWLDWEQTPRPCRQNRAHHKPDHHPPPARLSTTRRPREAPPGDERPPDSVPTDRAS